MDNPLLKPYPGLMIWTLITFSIAMFVLRRYAFGPIQEALDNRRQSILDMQDKTEASLAKSQELLAEYEKQLAEARVESEHIIDRARKAGDELAARIRDESEQQKRDALASTERQIQVEIEKAMDQIRTELASMTTTAVERVTRGALDAGAHQSLIEQAVNELDVDRLHKIGSR